MTSEFCSLLNCLQYRIKKLENSVSKNPQCTDDGKAKSLHCTTNLKILHSDIETLETTNDYVLIDNKLYQYNNGFCSDEYKLYKTSLEDLLQLVIEGASNIEIENKLSDISDRYIQFNQCLTTNSLPPFEPTIEIDIIEPEIKIPLLIDELNSFYISNTGVLITNITHCFFINNTEVNGPITEIIYFENIDESDDVIKKILNGECNVVLDCSTGKLYKFNSLLGEWSSICTLQTIINP